MPVRLGKLAQAAKKHGIRLEKPNRGSHWKFKFGSIVYPVPAGNGMKTEIDDVYVRALERRFDVKLGL